jgi:hypothetical protein
VTLTTLRAPAISHSIDVLSSGPFAPQNQSAATAWGTANRALYIPIDIPRRVVIRKLAYSSSTTGAGNIDIGLYDASGTLLVSSGSTAKSTSSDDVAVDVTDTTVGPGLHYIALNNSTTADTFLAMAYSAPMAAGFGVLQEALGSVTLPATATWSLTSATFIPIVSALLVTAVS